MAFSFYAHEKGPRCGPDLLDKELEIVEWDHSIDDFYDRIGNEVFTDNHWRVGWIGTVD